MYNIVNKVAAASYVHIINIRRIAITYSGCQMICILRLGREKTYLDIKEAEEKRKNSQNQLNEYEKLKGKAS